MSGFPWWAFAAAVAVVLVITATAGVWHLTSKALAARKARLREERVQAAIDALHLDVGRLGRLVADVKQEAAVQAWLRGEEGPPWEHS